MFARAVARVLGMLTLALATVMAPAPAAGHGLSVAPTHSASVQVSPTVRLRLDPANVDVVAGGSFDLAILVDAGTAEFDGADVRLDFDPAYFEVIDGGGNPTGSVEPGPDSLDGGLDPLLDRVDNVRGRIDYAAARLGDPLSGTIRLASARLLARGATGSTRIRFSFATGRVTDVTLASLLLTGPTDSVLVGVDDLTVTVTPRPQIAGLRIANPEPSALTVVWATDVPTTGRVQFGLAGSGAGAAALDGRGATFTSTVHFVRIDGLQTGQTYQFDVDSGGAVESRGGRHYLARTAASVESGVVVSGTVRHGGGGTPDGVAVLVRLRDGDGSGSPGESAPLATLTDAAGTWRLGLRPVAAVSGEQFLFSGADEVVVEVEGGASGTAAARAPLGEGGDLGTLTLEQSTNADLPITAGWNLLALPVEPAMPLAASDLVRLLQDSGIPTTQVVRWSNGRWNSYLAEFPANDFSLEVGHGYFVRAAGTGRLTLTGRPLRAAPTLDLSAGWNLVGVAYPRGGITVGALLAGAARTGHDVPQLARWDRGSWESYRADIQTGDFALVPGSAAFVQSANPARWRPAEP